MAYPGESQVNECRMGEEAFAKSHETVLYLCLYSSYGEFFFLSDVLSSDALSLSFS